MRQSDCGILGFSAFAPSGGAARLLAWSEMRVVERGSDRVRIRRSRPDDAARTFRWFADPLVTEFLPLAGERILPMASVVEFLEQVSRDEHPSFNVGIELLSGSLIGTGSLREIVPEVSAEISIVIGERHAWGQGYGAEAMELLLAEAFETLNLKSIWLIVRDENVRGVRLFSRLGFQVEETLRAAVVIRGVPRTKLRMRLDAAAWRLRSSNSSAARAPADE